jgi:hypothetical protein
MVAVSHNHALWNEKMSDAKRVLKDCRLPSW